jgi:GntR family phosphonate transport system transcriptional regulator
MMLREKWREIRQALEGEISEGRLKPGDRLPPEPELCERFGVGRHSLRRAIAELAYDGKLSVEQGRGTFVTEAPWLTYTIGRRTRLRRNLLAQGVDLTGDLLLAEKTEAPAAIARALELDAGAPVYRQMRITCANRVPIAFGTSWHPLARFPDFVERRNVFGSVTETYRSYGIADYLRKETTLHARPARDDEAHRLSQRPQQPVMLVRAVDADLDGQPIGASEVVWSAVRVKFTFETGRDCDD